MSRIELTGLIGSHPLGALASFGLLRAVSRVDPNARLCFVERDDWICALDSTFVANDELLAYLETWTESGASEVLRVFGDDDVRVAPSRFHDMVRDSLAAPTQGKELASFLVALAADGAEDNTKHLVKPSPFYMASGQQSFLDTLKRIRERVRKREAWTEALFGPWRYATSEWGAGWDPGTERMHALRFKAPTKDKTACVAAAVWLGFEALPLFPSFSVSGVVQTVGWIEEKRLDQFRWPVPARPVSVDALGVLLAAAEVVDVSRRRRPLREGVAAIYESTRHEFGQGYAVFRPAHRLG
jgi:hypothetical protein